MSTTIRTAPKTMKATNRNPTVPGLLKVVAGSAVGVGVRDSVDKKISMLLVSP
jgi:hypothetical protein